MELTLHLTILKIFTRRHKLKPDKTIHSQIVDHDKTPSGTEIHGRFKHLPPGHQALQRHDEQVQ